MSSDKRRPHLQVQVESIAARRLSGEGIAEVRTRPVSLDVTVEGCTVEVVSPLTKEGEEPVGPALLLPGTCEYGPLSPIAADAAIAFEHDGHVARAQVEFPVGTSFYGTGEVAGPLLRTGRAVTVWNTDAWCYGDETAALYQSHPYVLAVLADGSAVGLLASSFRRGRIEIASDGVEFQFEEDPFDLVCIRASEPVGVQRALAALIGRIELPPRWALGYHQCRWSYESAEEVRSVAAEFRKRDIPCCAIWFDIDYMERHRSFTWDREQFPDPKALVADLHETGMRAVAIFNPGVAVDAAFDVYQRGVAGSHFLRDANGDLVKGRVWPGTCHFPDFTSPEAAEWWAQEVRSFLDATPLDGIWNDMNEPSVLRSPTRTLPDSVRHAGLPEMGAGSHARYHNLYGQLMVQASREGFRRSQTRKRPFLLTRASHITGSRFAATWTGDNQSRWEDLRWSISMVLNLGLSGQPFSGPDVGGFYGAPSEELFVRWFELGAFLPFFRGHGEKSSPRKEPWSFGEEVERLVRLAIRRRERLLPTLYTLFHEAAEEGLPVARPLFFADPANPFLREIDDTFLLGRDLLVAPVVEPGRTDRTVILPSPGWYALGDEEEEASLRTGTLTVPAPLGVVPVFARAGSIVVLSDPDTGERTLHVFFDEGGEASGRSYEDEGDGFGYREGRYRDAHLTARASKEGVTLTETVEGELAASKEPRSVCVHGASAGTGSFTFENVEELPAELLFSRACAARS